VTRVADAEDRRLIAEALDETLVVEAAAGTGKTTELVCRIVRLIESGRATIPEIVAVTFSEKAAGELKLRLREELERARLSAAADSPEAERLARAVEKFEESHVSTIHGFCADLLRERPVEARIDPSFAVLTDGQAGHLYDEAFADWIQRELDTPCEGVRRSLRRESKKNFGADDDEAGPIDRLKRAGRELLEWRDHPRPWRRPDAFDRESMIDRLLDAIGTFAALSQDPIGRSEKLFTATRPLRVAWADVQQQRRRGHSDYDGWEATLCALAGKARELRDGRQRTGLYKKDVPREFIMTERDRLVDALVAFRDVADADLAAQLHAALAGATANYEARKQRAGAVDFLDLLLRARNLVKDDPLVRAEFQGRFRYLLVDEFQDTDPLQADLLLRLAADESAGSPADDPAAIAVRPGALFIVGDPKQSIYRFRRADVGAYRTICESLVAAGARRVRLRTSFRSVPAIQRAVNAAFSPLMTGDAATLQAEYVELQPSRDDCAGQPAVVALPVPRPYSDYGRVTQAHLAASQPQAIGEFVRWLVQDSGWTVPDEDGRDQGPGTGDQGKLVSIAAGPPTAEAQGPRRPIRAGDVCLLFRRFTSYQTDVTSDYVAELESRGVPHLLVGGRAFHEREEVDALRTALTAIEWPDDGLSVFATLRGPFFAVAEEELLAWHARFRGFRPFGIPEEVPPELSAVAEALAVLRDLNRQRNHRPVAETVSRLVEITRAHAGFVLWRGGEQVLANVLQIAELARRYEAEGGLSFRGFVDELRDAAERAPTPEAPILEEGTDGVRLMTAHKAKGLEFPVVILADIGARISRDRAQRHLDTRNELAAITLAGWTPLELHEHNALEAARDEAEGVRLAYVAATRARDVLVVPAIGDEPYANGWVSPLSDAIYGGDETTANGLPEFRGRDTVLDRPPNSQTTLRTMRPGVYTHEDPVTGGPYTVAWWDPLLLDQPGAERRGLRHEHLIEKKADPVLVAADRAAYERWRDGRDATIAAASRASLAVMTATEWAHATAEGAVAVPASLDDVARTVRVIDAGVFDPHRPTGARFGILVHALLAHVALDATADQIAHLAAVQARLLRASDSERAAAAEMVDRALRHALLGRARAARDAGRSCRREVPLGVVVDGVVVDGQADLLFDDGDRWLVVDFKTDVELTGRELLYQRQVALYMDAAQRALGAAKIDGALLRV
jgi:ATP-dependent helicase/nuclease subunit A